MGHASSFLLRDTVPTLRSAEGDNPLRSPSIARTEHERRPLDPEAANAAREYGDLGRRGNEEGRRSSAVPSVTRGVDFSLPKPEGVPGFAWISRAKPSFTSLAPALLTAVGLQQPIQAQAEPI